MCSYYEWFLYVNGNLIGIQLTLVAPIAGHGALLLLDLLISTWSLSLAGIAIGLLGGLSVVTAVVDTVNEKADVIGISKNKQMLKDLENGVVLDLERFIKDLRKSGTGDGKSDAELKEIFDQMDEDGDGTLTREEIDKYEQTVKREVPATKADVDSLRVELAGLQEQMKALIRHQEEPLAQAQEQALYEASVAKKAQARHSAGTAQARPRKEGLLKAARVKKGAATTSADDDDAYDAEEAALIAQVEEDNSVVRRRRVRARPSKEQPKLDEDVAPSSTPLLQAPEDDFSLADVEIAKMLQEQQRKSRERPFDSPSALGRLPGSLSALSHADADENGSIHGGASRFL